MYVLRWLSFVLYCTCAFAMPVLKSVVCAFVCVIPVFCVQHYSGIDIISSFSEESILFVVNPNASQSVQVQPYGMVTLTQVEVINSTSSGVPPSIEQILSLRVKATVEVNKTDGNGTDLETCGLIVINRQQEIVAAVDFRRLVASTLIIISV